MPQSLQAPMMGGLNSMPPQPVGSGIMISSAQTALQSAQYVVSNPVPLDRPAIPQELLQGPRLVSLEQQQSAPVSNQQGSAPSLVIDREAQARLVQQAQAAHAVVAGSDSDVKGEE